VGGGYKLRTQTALNGERRMQVNPQPSLAIIPRPSSITPGAGTYTLSRETVIVADTQTQAIGTALAEALAPALGFTLPVQPEVPADTSLLVLTIDPALTRLGGEGYRLGITPQQITIAGTAAGVFYGAQTLRQVLPTDLFSTTPISRAWTIPAVVIEDAPRFPWRGFMLDTARHFFPKEQVRRLIDLLALHKLNRLHLHLTDDQGWRVEIKKYPKLTSVGGWRKGTVIGHARKPQGFDGTRYGGFYTQDDLRELVAYAAARHITIVPEIDMPGHAQAAIAAYPELGVTEEQIEVGTSWGIFPHLFAPTQPAIQMLQEVLKELLDLFPGPYVHVGGDEAIKDQWKASPQVQARMQELGIHDEEALQHWFISQMGDFLTQHGRHLIGWDEILEGGLPERAIVMSWRGIEGGITAARAGHDVIIAPTSHCYFDYYQSKEPGEPLAIGGYLPLEKVYAFDPVPAALSPDEAAHVLGMQAALWSEYITTPDHLEYMAFPRTIALAEVAWSAPEQRDFADFLQRLGTHETRLAHWHVKLRPSGKTSFPNEVQ
jgi:hexosaminidase